jgi:CDP-diglyceride synthetase
VTDEHPPRRTSRAKKRGPETGPVDSGVPSDGVFIAGVEAAVAAGLVGDDDGGEPAGGQEWEEGYRHFDPEPPPESHAPPELLDWTEPATGQIPRVLLGDDEDPTSGSMPAVRGPVWREQGTDWDDDDNDLSHLTSEGEAVITESGGHVDDEDPFEFHFDSPEVAATERASREAGEDPEGGTMVYGPMPPGESAPAGSTRARASESPDGEEPGQVDPDIAWRSWAGGSGRGSSAGLTALGEVIASSGAPGSAGPEGEQAAPAGWRGGGRRHSRRRGGLLGDRQDDNSELSSGEAEGVDDETADELAPLARMRRRRRSALSAGADAGTAAGSGAGSVAGAGGTATLTESRPARRRPTGDERVRPEAAGEVSKSGPGRNLGVATLTGLGIGVLALICFALGSVATLALSTIALTAAGAECFAGMRRAGYRPATLVALIGIPALMICSYLKGPDAVEIVVAAFTVVTMLWYLTGVSREDPVSNIGATLAGFMWVGVLGSFAGLLLAPATFPHGNGVALMIGAIVPVVGYDVAAFAGGAFLGKHKLAPTISPGKTWEGLAAGTVAAIVLAAAVVSQIKPWTISSALAVGVIVAVLAPIGDLCESMFKRSLGLKDMGSLLPEHGGVLDRIDALLLVLPALYVFVRIAHIS